MNWGIRASAMVIALLSGLWAHAEPLSCLSPDIKKRIQKKMADPSPFAGCQQAFNSATQACSLMARGTTLEVLGTLAHAKSVQEKHFATCQKRLRMAKQNCASDPVSLGVLKAEFNDVVRCGDDSIAFINGRIMKEAQLSRRPASRWRSDRNSDDDYAPEDAVTDGEQSEEPAVAGEDSSSVGDG